MVKTKQNKAGYRPSVEEVSETLMADYIGAKPTELSAVNTDPAVPTPMVITLDEVDEFEFNPRQSDHTYFEAFCERILADKGLVDSLNITRRPGAEKYVLSHGGNTRLKALRKVYADTGETVYSRLNVLFSPYEGEVKMRVSHLAENNQRGGLMLIESAQSIADTRLEIENAPNDKLSEREFVAALKENGYTIDRKTIRIYDYAVNRLLEYIPKALYAGLGQRPVSTLKSIESRLLEYVEFKGMDRQQFNLIFGQILSEHDSDHGFSVDKVKDYLTISLCDGLNIDVYTFEVECDAFHLEGPDSSTFKQPILSANDAVDVDENSLDIDLDSSVQSFEASLLDENQTMVNRPKRKAGNTMHPIAQQRRTCMRIAIRLAQHFKIDSCIRTNYDIGFGFMVDFPEQSFDDPVIASVWWVLYSACGLTEDPMNRIHVADENMIMKKLILSNPTDMEQQFINHVGANDMSAFSMGLLFNFDIDERHVKDILDLSLACRKLLITAKQYGMTQELWTYK